MNRAWTTLLKMLYKDEGNRLHVVKGEKYVTSPGGITYSNNKDAKIFQYYNSLRRDINVENIRYTDKHLLDILNNMADKKIVFNLVHEDYDRLFKRDGIDVNLFHPEIVNTAITIYVNAHTNRLWKTIQNTAIQMNRLFPGVIKKEYLSTADGVYGFKTMMTLKTVNSFNKDKAVLFRTLMINNMKTFYIRLSTSNPDRYGIYLKGWDNRMNRLITS